MCTTTSSPTSPPTPGTATQLPGPRRTRPCLGAGLPSVGGVKMKLPCPPSPPLLSVYFTRSPVLRARKSSFNVSDAAGPEAAGSPPEEGIEGTPAKERRGECLAGPGGGRWLPVAHPGPSPETPLSPAGRGHQVHKSWPLSISDSDSGLDTGPGAGDGGSLAGWGVELLPLLGLRASRTAGNGWRAPPPGSGSLNGPDSRPGDFKKFERTSSSGTMSSTEELVDQEGGAGASAFEQGEGPLTGLEREGDWTQSMGLTLTCLGDTGRLCCPQLTSMA